MAGKGRRANAKGRSTGQIAPGQFFPMHRGITESKAWRSLKPASVKVYIELRSRHNSRPGHNNNGQIPLSCDDGARLLHMSKTTIMRPLAQLEEHGFIRCTKRGQWYGRIASEYAITDYPMSDGAKATQDWKQW